MEGGDGGNGGRGERREEKRRTTRRLGMQSVEGREDAGERAGGNDTGGCDVDDHQPNHPV